MHCAPCGTSFHYPRTLVRARILLRSYLGSVQDSLASLRICPLSPKGLPCIAYLAALLFTIQGLSCEHLYCFEVTWGRYKIHSQTRESVPYLRRVSHAFCPKGHLFIMQSLSCKHGFTSKLLWVGTRFARKLANLSLISEGSPMHCAPCGTSFHYPRTLVRARSPWIIKRLKQSLSAMHGDEGTRTLGLCVANASLYQLSHIPR